jgi:arylsulfatase I/J
VPSNFFHKFDFIGPTDREGHSRQLYHAMVNFADEAVGNVTTALKAKGMWEDTLVVFSADNGGPIYQNGSAGANNYPLKGGKMDNWEGGIRVNVSDLLSMVGV